MRPLAIDLYCGLGGWTEGLLAEGYDVVGFDIERHDYGTGGYPAQLVLQDAMTLHGRQFKDAALIVASPPCQEFSYMAMPWSKAKAKERDLLEGRDDPKRLTALFDACFRIQREAIEAAGHFIPLVVENVRGAQKWVGRSRWNYGSFHLWGDVPALMPMTKAIVKASGHSLNQGDAKWGPANALGFERQEPSLRKLEAKTQIRALELIQEVTAVSVNFSKLGSWFNDPNSPCPKHGSGRSFQTASVEGQKMGRAPMVDGVTRRLTNPAEWGTKQPRISGVRDNGKGDKWFQDGAARHGSKSDSRKAASAAIAKIPRPLAQYIARVYYPKDAEC